MKQPNPAIVAQTAVQRLPSWALVSICIIYIVTGLINRDPWKVLDISSFGYMWALAQGYTDLWHLELAGMTPDIQGPLAYALGGVFISLLGGWLTPDTAVRVPFMACLLITFVATWHAIYFLAKNPHAQPVVFAFGGEAHPEDYAKAIADAGLLALIACLGMALPSHETTPLAVQLCSMAVFFCGVAMLRTHGLIAVGLVDLALLSLGLSGAPFVALILSTGAVFLSFKQEDKRFVHIVLLIGGCLSLLILVSWADLWKWEILTAEDAISRWQGLIRLLLWFTWPAWPLAAWTLWTWRKQWEEHIWEQHLVLPVFLWFVVFIASISSKNPERTLLLSLPALACMAAFALPTLKRSVAALIDWFTLLFFTGGAVIIWVVWLSLQTGFPSQPAINVSRLAPGYISTLEWGSTCIAFIVSAMWGKLILWRLGRHPRFIWKSLVLPASGAVLCWVLLMTLWMPLLNYARSYKPLALQVKQLVGDPNCVFSLGLNRAQIAGLSFHANLKIISHQKNQTQACTWLITHPQAIDTQVTNLEPALWEKIKVIRRPSDKREDIVLYKLIVNSRNE